MIKPFTVLALCATSLIAISSAQSSVPSDLSSAFDPGSIALSVSYHGIAEQSFTDGSKLTQQETANSPLFALGDASGVNTAVSFVVMMVDTTTKDRTLHFLQTDFQANGDLTGIASSTQPLIPYKAPGALGEGGTRQYSFLLFQQIGQFPAQGLPTGGETVDLQSFMASNKLQAAEAGIAMSVDVSGGSSTPPSNSVAAGTTTAVQQMTTTMAQTMQSTAVMQAPPPPMMTSTMVMATSMVEMSSAVTAPPMQTVSTMAMDMSTPLVMASVSLAVVPPMASSASIVVPAASTFMTSMMSSGMTGTASLVSQGGSSQTTSAGLAQSTKSDASPRFKVAMSIPLLLVAIVGLQM